MRILWVATKAPWPPIDGGRLVLHETLRALGAAGHELTLVAPVAGEDKERERIAEGLRPLCKPHLVEARPRPLLLDFLRAQARREPLSVVRHVQPAVRRRVAELIAKETFDVVQVEQVQALDSASAAFVGSASVPNLPVVLRAQNVESDLWAQMACFDPWRRVLLQSEARRLARWEGRAVDRCRATIALTAEDSRQLAALAALSCEIHTVPAPFEAELPAAKEPLAGAPAIVLFGSSGWRPNAAGADWFLRQAWPRVLEREPAAQLHLFGLQTEGCGVTPHSSPADSRSAYPAAAILVVPLHVASGVRIKILEAWARGVPVVATSRAAQGLAAENGRHLLLADDGEGFATAIGRLAEDVDLRAALVANGRQRLKDQHAPSKIAEQLNQIYRSL